ncbi:MULTISPECIES: hypothetical protein [unclassified Mycolicibacterium]|uniref:hypothetical protein n=1 Tax=unclassified Mycolicibacterium TaxID=2636767 RepID=UPI002ED77600
MSAELCEVFVDLDGRRVVEQPHNLFLTQFDVRCSCLDAKLVRQLTVHQLRRSPVQRFCQRSPEFHDAGRVHCQQHNILASEVRGELHVDETHGFLPPMTELFIRSPGRVDLRPGPECDARCAGKVQPRGPLEPILHQRLGHDQFSAAVSQLELSVPLAADPRALG